MIEDRLAEEISGTSKHIQHRKIHNNAVHTQSTAVDSTGNQTNR